MNETVASTDGERGLEALKQGRVDDAFKFLSLATKKGSSDGRVLLAMAYTARAKSEHQICLDSINRYLEKEPKDISANIIKGDALAGLNRIRTAASFYFAAVQLAQNTQQMSPTMTQEVARASQACESAQNIFEDSMRNCITSINLDNTRNVSRLEQAVDIMMGKKEVYPQNPNKFYFPELPHIQFFDHELFKWAQEIKNNIGTIKLELEQLMESKDTFKPYIAHNAIAPGVGNMGLYESEEWSSFHLVQEGKILEENIARCPKTYELISKAPIAKIPGKSPNILFSKLGPGAHIPPHNGHMNIRLLSHLPLIVPEGCQLRVGNETRDVVEGEWMIFDDSIEHEAFNRSDQQRVVLIFDIWRPELSQKEQQALAAIFGKIDELE